MLLNDTRIRELCLERQMISPFSDHNKNAGISSGLGSYGYDAKLASEFKIFDNNVHPAGIIDPKKWDSHLVHKIAVSGGFVLLPPHSFTLAHTVEYFKIPRDVLVICLGKSTYARCGLIVNVTPFEPEWEGQATLELSNTTPFPLRVYVNEGIVQLLFFKVDELCEVSYADKHGKYQSQLGIVEAR